MEDIRVAINNSAKLQFDKSGRVYIIQEELGRGASCIVYNAYYVNNLGNRKKVRIREYYPYRLNIVRRLDGSLCIAQEEVEKFEMLKENFKQSFKINNCLFDKDGLTNSIVNTYEIYEYNNTVYSVTMYQEGEILNRDKIENLKDAILSVKSVSQIIQKIHEAGYLYLDIKPENICVLKGITKGIQLFDFDSLIPINADGNILEYRISYTKGFAPLEQRSGRMDRIGRYSDVYSIGALLFYLLYGRTPSTLDGDCDTRYDLESTRYNNEVYQDKLLVSLGNFFHKTIACYYGDRYQNMQEVIEALEQLAENADVKIPFIVSSKILKMEGFTGRDIEMDKLLSYIYDDNMPIIAVTGMGGIGKSTLVRQCLLECKDDFDCIISIDYMDSIIHTFADDVKFMVNTLTKDINETESEYFYRKIKTVSEYNKDKRILIVLDNYEGTVNDELKDITNICSKLIIITRNENIFINYPNINIGAINDRLILRKIFENNLLRPLKEAEYDDTDRIISAVCSHTMLIELIARQINSSAITINYAADMVEERGFACIAPERVRYAKDGNISYKKISEIVLTLFHMDELTSEMRRIIKMLSLFGRDGVIATCFSKVAGTTSLDIVNQLINLAWIKKRDTIIYFHPVILETIIESEWTNEDINAAIELMSRINNLDFRKKQKSNYAQFRMEIYNMARNVMLQAEHIECLTRTNIYHKMYIKVLINTPIDEEDFIIKYALKMIRDNKKNEELWQQGQSNNKCEVYDSDEDAKDMMGLWDRVTYIWCEQKNIVKAYRVLPLIDRYVSDKSPLIKGMGAQIRTWVYESALGEEEYKIFDRRENILKRMLKESHEQELIYYSMSDTIEGRYKYAICLLGKATIMIRHIPLYIKGVRMIKKSKIDALLKQAEDIIAENIRSDFFKTDSNTTDKDLLDAKMSFYLAKAWYYLYVVYDMKKSGKYIEKAYKNGCKLYNSKTDLIKYAIIPAANIYIEFFEIEKSVMWLDKGIAICDEYKDIAPYRRLKKDLERYKKGIHPLKS